MKIGVFQAIIENLRRINHGRKNLDQVVAQAMRAHEILDQRINGERYCNCFTGRRAGFSTFEIGGKRVINPLNLSAKYRVGKLRDYGTSPKDYGQMLQEKRKNKKGGRHQ